MNQNSRERSNCSLVFSQVIHLLRKYENAEWKVKKKLLSEDGSRVRAGKHRYPRNPREELRLVLGVLSSHKDRAGLALAHPPELLGRYDHLGIPHKRPGL